jgi:hypothetical protein
VETTVKRTAPAATRLTARSTIRSAATFLDRSVLFHPRAVRTGASDGELSHLSYPSLTRERLEKLIGNLEEQLK